MKLDDIAVVLTWVILFTCVALVSYAGIRLIITKCVGF